MKFYALALLVTCVVAPSFGTAQIKVSLSGGRFSGNRVHLSRKTADGKVVWRKDFRHWNNFAVDRDGNTLFTGNDQLLKISPEGKVLWKHPSDREPCVVTTDESGNVFRAMLIDQEKSRNLLKLVKLSPRGEVEWIRWDRFTTLHQYDICLEAMVVVGNEIRILSELGAMATLNLDGHLVRQTAKATSAQKSAFPPMHPYKLTDRFGASVVLNIDSSRAPYDGGYQPEIFWPSRPPAGEKKRIVIDPAAVRGFIYGGEEKKKGG